MASTVSIGLLNHRYLLHTEAACSGIYNIQNNIWNYPKCHMVITNPSY